MRKLVLLTTCGFMAIGNAFATSLPNFSQEKTVNKYTDYQKIQKISNGVLSPVMSQSLFLSLSSQAQKIRANIFNLTVDQYKKYLYYMNNTMDGYEYQHSMNPNLVLALHTKDKHKYYQYIKNAVVADHDAIGKMIKVSNDYTRIAKEVYPNELPIMTPQMRAQANNTLQPGDIAQVYCKINLPNCANLLSIVLPKIMRSNGVSMDIFAVGNANKSNIVSFAKRNNISSAIVSSHKVTLNYGSSAFKHLEQQAHKKLPLPFLLVRRNGMQIPVNLGDSK